MVESKSDIMVDPNKIRSDSVKHSVVSTARKYVSKTKNFRDFWMNFDYLWRLIRIYASWLTAVRSPWAHWNMLSFCTTSVIVAILKIGNILVAALWLVWKAMMILKSFTRNLKKCTPRFVILIDFKHFFSFLTENWDFTILNLSLLFTIFEPTAVPLKNIMEIITADTTHIHEMQTANSHSNHDYYGVCGLIRYGTWRVFHRSIQPPF